MVWLLRSVHETHCSFILAPLLGPFALGEASCHGVSTLKEPYRDVFMAKNCGFFLKISKKLKTSVNYESEPF